MKLLSVAAALAVLVAGAAPAQAQIKWTLIPKSKSEIQAQRAAKAEREAQVRRASEETHRRHEEAFAKADEDRNGRINLDEFKEAALHLEQTTEPQTR